jgi:molecular chaperone IbpA
MRTYDFSPLYRSAIGFDRLAQLAEAALRHEQPSYPPYNIELVSEDRYRISMALAGFSREELDVEVEKNALKVIGRKATDSTPRNWLHRGIAARDFEQHFQLADHVKVVAANFENGLLNIELEREIPEAYKPRKILIDGGESLPLIKPEAA